MITIVIGAILLSAIHAMLPNHWVPLVLLGRAEGWRHRETLAITAVAAFTHTVSTVIIGILVGLVGWRLSQSGAIYTRIVAPALLAGIGLIYIGYDLSGSGSHRHCHHHGADGDHTHDSASGGRTKTAIMVSLLIAMFFSPCLEIEAYYFTAAKHGWVGILTVSAIYVCLTVVGMVALVHLGLKGLERLRWHLLEHHERLVSGLVLVGLGAAVYFIEL